ncbi:MAG: hypothetical protein U5L08_06355 [Xanthomonadales bacterium]|nr:hypothetical protein [Xanthomonadales bacterium]
MPVPTTTIGAYPKPDYVPLRGWHEAKPEAEQGRHPADPTRPLRARRRVDAEEEQRLFDRATREVVAEQAEIGIDVPTDGEVRREHYVFYHLRHLHGIDFENLEERELRQGGWTAYVPVVRQPVQAGPRFLRHDWQSAQAATGRPVKITVPGPPTIAGTIADAHYGDERALCAALGDALNQELRDLAHAGCPWIQVDEPLFARHPDKATAFGVATWRAACTSCRMRRARPSTSAAAIRPSWTRRTIPRPTRAPTPRSPRPWTWRRWTRSAWRTPTGRTTPACWRRSRAPGHPRLRRRRAQPRGRTRTRSPSACAPPWSTSTPTA